MRNGTAAIGLIATLGVGMVIFALTQIALTFDKHEDRIRAGELRDEAFALRLHALESQRLAPWPFGP